MEYRGVKYTITQGPKPDVWRWRTVVGQPEMLRTGEASSEMKAELYVKKFIDWSLARQEAQRRSKPDDDPTDSD
jgi:hypothetical protein